ncbi:type I-C CRISPR-associated protein Cas7/Csd2 [Pseudoflavonifractor sp. MSJ-30]|uniref:type I-C CRISPR-associated protein Cas7/Csd2 n=1 Tax=Pseudoflavonifractor sp. MSJ-30 TaxID=2841525 RepID=UPI001C0F8BD0|nr:type I-C CRISPR-associated protein Cas7/Csd2 [Pseudoflavonifractor sp. MSJ-30]MBU5451579.1 type I-C CRISPR-associated protein Cas7/Csd2 [Pseudoflavonifractor sp. MSJ-30]
MSTLKNKIDFVALVSVTRANGNGDPLNGNRPRTDLNGFGEISDVCIKRKIRNRMQDLGNAIFVQSEDRRNDEFDSLKSRADAMLPGNLSPDTFYKTACETWLDVRTFGQVFAYSSGKGDKKGKGGKKTEGEDNEKGVSIGVRGPVSIHQAISASPVDIESLQITKSVSGEKKDGNRGSDTMGTKHFVRFGLYEIKGSINVQLAEKTGFSQEDAETVKECLRTLFVNDASSARPEGSMEVVKLFWWQHNCKDGQYSSAKVHRSVKVAQKDPGAMPASVDDYVITLEPLPGLEPEIIDGI